MNKSDLQVYLVTDRDLCLGRNLVDVVREAVIGGVTMVQLREKNCDTGLFVKLAQDLKQLLQPYRIPLIINDRLDVALAVDADGVHIGQSDMPYDIARQILGANKIIGLSVENMEQVLAANELDVDYIGVSPVFSTATKTDIAQPFGLVGLKKASELSKHPIVAIGGIHLNNAKEVIQNGADGLAVVSEIISANNPMLATKQLKELWKF